MRPTNFFVAQRYYTRMSQLLYGLFVFVVLVQFLLLLLVMGGITYVLTGEFGVFLLLWASVLLGGYLLLGIIVGQQKTKQGGMSIAKQTHAVRLFVHQGDQQPVFSQTFIRVASVKQLPASYQRYYEFAEQMSIASGVPLPKLYVLPFEMGVNAFVAGFDDHDTVMVLTQGAVEKLTNTELYGLLGHEFGHIIHGDARLNLKIYIYLTMLGWVYDLADVLEEAIFGKFNRNYHDDLPTYQFNITAPTVPSVHDKKAWIAYLRQSRHMATQAAKFSDIKSSVQENQLYALMASLMVATPLVMLRLFGVVGMAFAEWIKQKFNHQREFLADATSVQLTRSPDVAQALMGLQKRHSTTLYSSAFTTGMSHFFFANPKAIDDRLAYSHPDVTERLQMVVQGRYADFGKQMTAKMNTGQLDDAQHFAHHYEYVLDDQTDGNDEHQDTQSGDETTVIEFVAEPELVIDGRLVVDSWRELDTPQPIYPQRATCHQVLGDDFDVHTEHITLETIQGLNLPWQMIKALCTTTGTLAMIESVLLCHYHQTVMLHSKVHMHQIYQPTAQPVTPILPHALNAELLEKVSAFDRRLDGLLLTVSLERLSWHISQSGQSVLTTNYQKGLELLLDGDETTVNKMACFDGLGFDHCMLIKHRIQGSLEVLYRAVVMATVWRLLAQHTPTSAIITQKQHTLLGYLMLAETKQSVACVLLVLLFLVGVQDNSLYLCRYDKLIGSLRRLSLLLQIEPPSDTVLIKLMHQVWLLDEMDWLALLFGIDDTKPQPILEVICTALVYNGQLGQREYDLLSALVVLWQGEMPVV